MTAQKKSKQLATELQGKHQRDAPWAARLEATKSISINAAMKEAKQSCGLLHQPRVTGGPISPALGFNSTFTLHTPHPNSQMDTTEHPSPSLASCSSLLLSPKSQPASTLLIPNPFLHPIRGASSSQNPCFSLKKGGEVQKHFFILQE